MQAHIWYLCLKNFWIFLKGLIWTRFVIYTFVPKICDTCKLPTYEVGIYFGMLGFISTHSPTIVWICSSLILFFFYPLIFSCFSFTHKPKVGVMTTIMKTSTWRMLYNFPFLPKILVPIFYSFKKNRNNLNVGLSLVFPI